MWEFVDFETPILLPLPTTIFPPPSVGNERVVPLLETLIDTFLVSPIVPVSMWIPFSSQGSTSDTFSHTIRHPWFILGDFLESTRAFFEVFTEFESVDISIPNNSLQTKEKLFFIVFSKKFCHVTPENSCSKTLPKDAPSFPQTSINLFCFETMLDS